MQYFGELGQEVRVFRNDEIDVAGIAALKPDHLVLSPGPLLAPRPACACRRSAFIGKPADPGRAWATGASAPRWAGASCAPRRQMHGSQRQHRRPGSVCRAAAGVTVIRYHSLVIERDTGPAELVVTATRRTARSWACGTASWLARTPLEGVQFHPGVRSSSMGTRCCGTSCGALSHDQPR